MQRVVFASFSIIIIFIFYFLLNSTNFERIKPRLELYVIKDKNIIYPFNSPLFNPLNDIKLHAFDSSGLSKYSIKVTNTRNETILEKNDVLLKRSQSLDIVLPKLPNLENGDKITYSVSVEDWSNANFFRGNKTTITKHFTINTIAPKIQIIATSEQIAYGGSALIAFQIQDLPLYQQIDGGGIHSVMVSNGQNNFKAYPYINKQGKLIYLALIAWPITNSFFDGKIYVFDKAMNEQSIVIPIATSISFVKRKFNVIMSDKNLEQLIERIEKYTLIPSNMLSNAEKFQYLNESIRQQDNRKIADFFQPSSHNITISNDLPYFNAFNPIDTYQISGHFGDEHIFKHNKNNIGTSIRLGIDLLSPKHTTINGSNDGIVLYTGKLGTYGNIVVLYHDLGLGSIYGYLDEASTTSGHVTSSSILGIVGRSGFATTHSVYFATLLQGYFVNPREWLNQTWINNNINRVLKEADNFGIMQLSYEPSS